jgi:hypothetical protein
MIGSRSSVELPVTLTPVICLSNTRRYQQQRRKRVRVVTVVSNILCKRRFVVLALGYSAAAVEAVRMWEAFFALHICIA